MTASRSAHRRLLVTVDMERYSRKDNRSQFEAQLTFRRALDSALAEYGVTVPEWDVQRAGDSVLALLRAEIIEIATIVGPVSARIDELLREHNRDRNDLGRVRLRMAVHEGAVHPNGPNGVPGDAVNLVCRLRDAQVLKRILKAFPDAALALMVSPRVYDDVVHPQYCGIRRDRFRKVAVVDDEHDLRTEGWLSVVGEDVSRLVEPSTPPGAASREPAPGRSVPRATYYAERVDNNGAFAFGEGARAFNHGTDEAER
ncbi:hypothetical protein [Phytomonospora endophytica]|uniref:Guanylate cyclase domain-containing protein n=1 Tax=Phytomonospora endophytica TaxID=714109 RepID=A0A841FLT0_9ACTN|nr:hypothetical protein [Phytomonospora endophytica]MBB6032910.1 hypothetical protein [Phytomonospora endophytica]GIG65136.1 hypothetical protein Pen01_14310 [Phytomonospora endophytica]